MPFNKVCLIRPSIFTTSDSLGVEIMLPFGPAYLAAYLRQEGFDISFIDALGEGMNQYTPLDDLPNSFLRGLTHEETAQRIPADVEVIGVSSMFSVNWVVTRHLIETLRRHFPTALLLVGGEHATALPEYCLRNAPEIDYLVIGEGEQTTVELLKTLAAGGVDESVPGIAFLRNGQYRATTARLREKDLSVFPWPAWDLLPVADYLRLDPGERKDQVPVILRVNEQGELVRHTVPSQVVDACVSAARSWRLLREIAGELAEFPEKLLSKVEADLKVQFEKDKETLIKEHTQQIQELEAVHLEKMRAQIKARLMQMAGWNA